MAKDPIQLAGKVVAITGGARGIGRETAKSLIDQGMKVAIGDIDTELVKRTADELGHGTIGLELDVTDRSSFEGFMAQIEEQVGPVYALINNAGIMPIGLFVEESDDVARRQIDINVHGVLHGMKIALPGMIARGTGHVINIASMAGKAGVPGVATYCGTKHFVVGVTEATYPELQDTGVALSYVCPAVVNTELTSGVEATRGVKVIEPGDVADAIVEALQFQKVDHMVPKSVRGVTMITGLLPRKAREVIGRAMKADKIMIDVDQAARKAYVDRTTGVVADAKAEQAEKVN